MQTYSDLECIAKMVQQDMIRHARKQVFKHISQTPYVYADTILPPTLARLYIQSFEDNFENIETQITNTVLHRTDCAYLQYTFNTELTKITDRWNNYIYVDFPLNMPIETCITTEKDNDKKRPKLEKIIDKIASVIPKIPYITYENNHPDRDSPFNICRLKHTDQYQLRPLKE